MTSHINTSEGPIRWKSFKFAQNDKDWTQGRLQTGKWAVQIARLPVSKMKVNKKTLEVDSSKRSKVDVLKRIITPYLPNQIIRIQNYNNLVTKLPIVTKMNNQNNSKYLSNISAFQLKPFLYTYAWQTVSPFDPDITLI